MAIQLVDKSTEFHAGQFICVGRCGVRGIYGRAMEITEVRGSRIHFKNDENRGSFIYRKEIAVLCDTKEEADEVIALAAARDRARSEELARANERVDSDFAEKFRAAFGLHLDVDRWTAQRI